MITIGIAAAGEAAWDAVRKHAAAEEAAGCDPSGYEILIEANAVEGIRATLRLGSVTIPLGRATVDFALGEVAHTTG